RMIPATSITRLASLVPVVTLAGTPVPGAMNVRCDNDEGMRRLVRHLVLDHGYKELGYLSGRIDSPDNHARARAIEAEAKAHGAQVEIGHDWQGDYSAAGGARLISGLLDSGRKLPRAIVCANDQTALGAMARRLVVYLLAAWVAITVSFLLPRVVPGNPVAGAVARASQSGNCNEQCVVAIELQLGYNVHTSLWDQYTQYLGNLAHGDLGHSWSENAPVASLIVSYLPWTLVLLGIATTLAFLGGSVIGTLIAWRRGSWTDWLLPFATFFQALPYFFLGIVLVLILGQTGTMLKWFPSLFGYDIYTSDPGFNLPYIQSVISHGILPVATIVLASLGGFILSIRNQVITTMDEDFVLVAQAKGLPARTVIWYAVRNALLPVVANFTIAISLIVGGQILVEIVFSYPGIGFHLYDALGKIDYPLVQGVFVVITLVVLAANLIADAIYVAIDPRVRQAA